MSVPASLRPASVWRPKRSWSLLRKDVVAAAETWTSALSTPELAARSVCGHLIREIWDLHVGDRGWLPEAPGCQAVTSTEMVKLLRLAAQHLQERPLVEASYGVGLLYTDLLPSDVRAARGAYYTPPVLAERLLDLASAEGVDWSTITALDPACGGGAFLVPVAMRKLGHPRLRDRSPQEQLAHPSTLTQSTKPSAVFRAPSPYRHLSFTPCRCRTQRYFVRSSRFSARRLRVRRRHSSLKAWWRRLSA